VELHRLFRFILTQQRDKAVLDERAQFSGQSRTCAKGPGRPQSEEPETLSICIHLFLRQFFLVGSLAATRQIIEI
jgi:hypothetical protein